jgi:CcmD family protein
MSRGHRRPRWRGRLVVAVWIVLAAVAALEALTARGPAGPMVSRASAWQPRGEPPRSPDEFVPVSELPPNEQLPAAPLLVAAYAVAWVAVLAYVWSLWRRLGRVQQELRAVRGRVERQEPR